MNNKINEISNVLKTHLDEARLEHTMGVMYTAAAMAMRYNEDLEKTMIAGILHDCAKCVPGNEKISLCEEAGVEITEIERKNPGLLHAKLGAVFAKEIYHIDDDEILNAIISHTTGRPEMTLLDKIIYIADYMEPGRKELPNMAEVRKLAFENIDECLFRILKDSLTYLATREMPIDPMTENTYYYYKEILDK
jgi:predicted HD superfamily hydrolase involved in NAD metabolism